MREIVRDSQALRLYVMQLLIGLAFVSLILATGGVFITTAYSVWQREHELNIRVACGATPWHILWTVIGRSSQLVICGLAVGGIAVMSALPQFGWAWRDMQYFNFVAWGMIPVCLGSAALLAASLVALQPALRESTQRS